MSLPSYSPSQDLPSDGQELKHSPHEDFNLTLSYGTVGASDLTSEGTNTQLAPPPHHDAKCVTSALLPGCDQTKGLSSAVLYPDCFSHSPHSSSGRSSPNGSTFSMYEPYNNINDTVASGSVYQSPSPSNLSIQIPDYTEKINTQEPLYHLNPATMEIDSSPLNPSLALDYSLNRVYAAGFFPSEAFGASNPSDEGAEIQLAQLPQLDFNFLHPCYRSRNNSDVSSSGGSTFSMSDSYESSPSPMSDIREDNDAFPWSELPGSASASTHQLPAPPNLTIEFPDHTETVSTQKHRYDRIPASTKTILQYIQEVTKQDQQWLNCQFNGCNFSCKEPQSIFRHMEKRHFKGIKLYECVSCHQQFVSEASAKRHQACQTKKYRCSIW
ncbi:hypothetical protein BU17DRAFT_68761 [Hysterangium stoloniferum]|nr:hypothetical protein BU17DRAFT_68761 [Hysterangium stoloniferum]